MTKILLIFWSFDVSDILLLAGKPNIENIRHHFAMDYA
jgi:hypothetical protein